MARIPTETAEILTDLYNQNLGHDTLFQPFRITWPQLRSLAGVPRLNEDYLKDVSGALAETQHTLIHFDNYLLVAAEQDLSHYHMVPDRILEQYLPDADQTAGEDDDTLDNE